MKRALVMVIMKVRRRRVVGSKSDSPGRAWARGRRKLRD